MTTRFDDRVVIVTGAGSGIGAATARRFSAEGAAVVLVGRRAEKLHEVARELPEDRTFVRQGDVSKRDDVEGTIAETVARFGHLDVVVNNAAIAEFGPLAKVTDDAWRATFATNVDAIFYAARAAFPHLRATGGSIVNVSSVSGIGGDWGLATYNASKGAVSNFTRALALEYGGAGVRVNAVAPSLTESEMTEDLTANEAAMAKFRDRITLGRAARPEEVAAAIAFLASADASFVNGVVLPVDGGLGASNGQPRLM